ncbi:CinA-like protein [Geotalea uraniireducens]|uniref:CinA-like protein n=1 Tax=Geotalea uraniireducens TaxID=351604 RepID=A0ABN6VYN8_9BACT|nr:competence/damage-inducible protein A [Geotalea uraniireducens]BDV44699.1 CinA-like protein [Geotalea uraniireducens]
MKAALLSIGDELLLGETVDTNAAVIAGRLYGVGVAVRRQLTVGDDEEAIAEALDSLAAEHQLVIATGGLGPTDDDVTARAAAQASGRRLVLHEEALARLQDFFARRGREMHPANERQCLLPARVTLVPNPTGTASGFQLLHRDCLLIFLPGVPGEMVRMLEETVLPLVLARRDESRVVRTRQLTLFGVSEAEIGARLTGLTVARPGLGVAYCVDYPLVQVRLRGEGDGSEAVQRLLDGAAAEVRERLGEHIVAEDGESIDLAVARLFREKRVSLALAESCTGGLIAKRITDVAGSSAYFLLGAVTYANGAKVRLLDVPEELLAAKGAVSAEVAMAMAKGARRLAGSDLALAVTGIAGPEGGDAVKPVGTVFIALADRAGCTSKEYRFSGSRDQIRTVTAVTALDWLRRRLLTL